MTPLTMGRFTTLTICILLLASCTGQSGTPLEFAVSFDQAQAEEALDGRILLIISDRADPEPRFQVSAGTNAPQVFGVDMEGMEPGTDVVIDANVFGFPHASLADVPPGDYYVQAVLHRYETFNLSNGKTVKQDRAGSTDSLLTTYVCTG